MQPTTAPAAPHGRRAGSGSPFVPGPAASRRLAIGLAVVLGALAVGHVVSMTLRYGLGRDYFFGLVHLLDLDREQSIGTWVATGLLLVGAQLAALTALVTDDRWRRNWWLLAAVLALVSLDEVAGMHEDLIVPMRQMFGLSGILYYGWIVPLVAAGALFLLAQLRFLLHLGRPTGIRLVVAGLLFVTGAAGLEVFEALLAEAGGKTGAEYAAVAGVEEVLEGLGSALATWALFDHLAGRLREREELTGAPRAVASPRPHVA